VKKITCAKCLTYMIAKNRVRINFCFTCGMPVKVIPDDAWKDFTPDLSGKSRQELSQMKSDQMQKLVDSLLELNKSVNKILPKKESEIPEGLKFDWEKKDWYKQLKTLNKLEGL